MKEQSSRIVGILFCFFFHSSEASMIRQKLILQSTILPATSPGCMALNTTGLSSERHGTCLPKVSTQCVSQTSVLGAGGEGLDVNSPATVIITIVLVALVNLVNQLVF